MKNLLIGFCLFSTLLNIAFGLDGDQPDGIIERNYKDLEKPIYKDSYWTGDTVLKDGIVKVVSYNLNFSNEIPKIIYQLKHKLYLKSADVILLQEVVGFPGFPGSNGADSIAKELKMDYVYIPAFIHPENNLDFGVAILSRYPLRDVKKLILPHHHLKDNTQRVALGATILVEGLPIRIYSTHLEKGISALEKNDQVDHIMLDNDTARSDVVLLGGDFNTKNMIQRKKLIKNVKSYEFQDATYGIGSTKRSSRSLFRSKPDHIFTKGLWIIGKGKAPFSSASDHNAIWSVIRIKDRISLFNL